MNDIQYLQKLRDNPTMGRWQNIPIPISEITQLEALYNSGNPFPKALKELLFLAGGRCIVLDYGATNSQQHLQEWVRQELLENGKVFSRPFYAIDVYDGDYCIFLYLDEGDNPPLYYVYYEDEAAGDSLPLRQIQPSLSNLINNRVQRVIEGFNPF
jgi:hypothetical protein